MKENIKKVLLIGFLFLFIMPQAKAVKDAQTLGDLRRNYEDLLEQKQNNDNKTAETKAEIQRKEQAIKDAQADLTAAEKEEHETQEKINESNAKIEKLTEEAKKVLLYLQQMQGQNAYVEYVSGASTMTDLITRIAAVEQVTDSIQRTMEELEAEIKRNEELKIELQEKQAALQVQIKNYQNAVSQLYSNLDEFDKFAPSIKEQVDSAKKEYDTYLSLCRERLNRTDDNVYLADCTEVPVNGGWLKPLNQGVITSEVGSRWGSYHNGLDIGGNPEGTEAYAAAAGRVSGRINYSSCGGNMVFVQVTVGGERFTMYYYHLLRVNVNVNDIVNQNTIIGWIGGGSTASYDNCTFGAHLHFGVVRGWYTVAVPRANTIVPPGFPNTEGWRFNSRTAWYG